MGVRIASLLAVAAISMFSATRAESNHGTGNPLWTSNWTRQDFYPSNNYPGWQNGGYRDHHLRYRVCLGYQNIADYALWDWFNRFQFNQYSQLTRQWVIDCGDGSTDLLFWITTDGNATAVCGGPQACYRPTPFTQVYDNFVGKWVDTKSEIIVSSSLLQLWSGNQGMQIHIFEHEVGHMFGMAHHLTTCTVMSGVYVNGQQCGYWVTPSDAGTARCIYIYAC